LSVKLQAKIEDIRQDMSNKKQNLIQSKVNIFIFQMKI